MLTTKNIVFVTGAFVSSACWDEWRIYFEKKGYNTIAPAWPFKTGTAASLRAKQPNDVELATLTFKQLVDHYVGIVKSFPEKPIVIGHSLGGMITQIICNRDLAAAAVAIHSVPPMGVIPYEFSFLKAGWRVLGIGTSLKKTYLMSFKTWQYAFVNGMPYEEQKAAYDQFTIPESKTVARGALTSAAKVDFKKAHPPLLLTAGTEGTIIPAHLSRRIYNKYKKDNGSIIEYKEFPGRNHFVLGQPGWEGDADYILDWLKRV